MTLHFQKFAQPLTDNGYLVIPIERGQKRPAIKDWVNYRIKPGDTNRFASCGVGILTGQGELPVYAVDIDSMAADLVTAMVAWCFKTLGPTIQRTGRPPKTLLLYRGTTAGVTKVTGPTMVDASGRTGRVEVLGAGQQFVAYGTHPITHAEYQWRDLAGGVLGMPVRDLPTRP